MSPAQVLRVVTFRALGPDSAIDAVLRSTVLPRLLEERGVESAWQGRRSGDVGHVLASTWTEPPAAEAAADVALLGDPAVAEAGGVEILTVEEGTVGVATAFDRDEPARILRVFHGRVRTGELDAYIAEVEAGVAADARVNDGLVSFVLGHDGNDRFTSVSTWTGWSAIEAATGGNTRQPFATRHALRLTGFEIAHLELLPEAPVQRPARVDSEFELAT